jgi:cytochrome c peroxidase
MLSLASCQRAQRYRTEAKKPELPPKPPPIEIVNGPIPAWLEPEDRSDLPIRFIADDQEEWAKLKEFWTDPPVSGMPTIHLGLDPFSAVAALAAVEPAFTVKIKVPRGLPDPKPHFPPSNPPSFGKWKLGKELFFTAVLPTATGRKVCASCHHPKYNFSDDLPHAAGGDRHTLSLVNAVYNRRQVWDGRVRTLEETFAGKLIPTTTDNVKAADPHNWSGLVQELVEKKTYDKRFEIVFGVPFPTQDTVAQALATYIRTILSGDSLYDRAGLSGLRFQPKELPTAKLAELLQDKNIAANFVERDKMRSPQEIAVMVSQGHALFYGKARCSACHSGPLLTDHDYHNIGLVEPEPGVETGRALFVPIGLKEGRLMGAWRTPTLRNLLKTGPYFHDGSRVALAGVVDYYDNGALWVSHVARPLLEESMPRRLKLTQQERESLVMFLRALEGMPVDPIVSKN